MLVCLSPIGSAQILLLYKHHDGSIVKLQQKCLTLLYSLVNSSRNRL